MSGANARKAAARCDQRFGWTRYEKKPDNPAWSVACEELRAFWVSEDDSILVTDDEVEAHLRK
jgi:hypothetical protein